MSSAEIAVSDRTSLIAVADNTPPISSPLDAEVDLEVLKIVPKQFCVEDENTANWVVKRIIAAREYGQHVKEWAEQERRRAEREEQTLMFLFGRQVEQWAKKQIDALNGRRKSINLPGGTVGFRHLNTSIVIVDETAVLDWARRNQPKAIQAKEYLSKTIINEHFAACGEVPPGTEVESERDKFFIR